MELDDFPESYLQGELLKGEKVYWTGRPDVSRIFSPADIFLVPFTLMWGGFSVFWELSVLGLTPLTKSETHHAPFFFALFGIPFVLIGLYITIGRFFYKVWKRKRTYYVITNKRVLQVVVTANRRVQALFLNQTAAINKYTRSDGSGTVTFGNTSYYMPSYYANTGMDFLFLGNRYGGGVFAFFDIPDVDRIYQMIQQLRGQAG